MILLNDNLPLDNNNSNPKIIMLNKIIDLISKCPSL